MNAVYGGGSGDAGEDGFGSGGTSSTDLEMGGDVGFSTPRKSGLTLRSRGVRQRLLRASPAMSKLQPIAQNPKVHARRASCLWCVGTGRKPMCNPSVLAWCCARVVLCSCLDVWPLMHTQVAKAIDVVDRFTLRTGFFLSREPLARLMFLVCVVLVFLVRRVMCWSCGGE